MALSFEKMSLKIAVGFGVFGVLLLLFSCFINESVSWEQKAGFNSDQHSFALSAVRWGSHWALNYMVSHMSTGPIKFQTLFSMQIYKLETI